MNDLQLIPTPFFDSVRCQPGSKSYQRGSGKFAVVNIAPCRALKVLECNFIWILAVKYYGISDVSIGGCLKGQHQVCLCVNAVDYHWFRQDDDGSWSHKPGSTPVVNVCNGTIGKPITDPDNEASKYGYETKCRCGCVSDTH